VRRSKLDDREPTLVALAAVVSDVGGLGLIPGMLTRDTAQAVFRYSEYHHVLAHNLLSALITTALVAVISRREALLAFVAYQHVSRLRSRRIAWIGRLSMTDSVHAALDVVLGWRIGAQRVAERGHYHDRDHDCCRDPRTRCLL
jgi:hypothetical protein